MRLSCFNHYVDGYPEPGSTLIHNTLSGGFVVVDAETLAALHKADGGAQLSPDERELVDDPDLRDPDVGVVVESREAEEAEFQAWFERKRSRKTQLEALISINLACNFECPYCSQAGILDGTVMKADVADRTADWLVDRALETGVGGIYLAFCGGEPLLHPERIARIARRIRERALPAGLTFSFMAITNGYFLDQKVLDLLVPLGFEQAEVTIDGDESTHKLTRVSKKGEDTFARIFDNVIAASKRLRIYINGNYTPQTVHGFIPLLGKLADAGLPAGVAGALHAGHRGAELTRLGRQWRTCAPGATRTRPSTWRCRTRSCAAASAPTRSTASGRASSTTITASPSTRTASSTSVPASSATRTGASAT